MPVVLSSVHQLPEMTLGEGCTVRITLIARRSAQRAGTRHWRRGADSQVDMSPLWTPYRWLPHRITWTTWDPARAPNSYPCLRRCYWMVAEVTPPVHPFL